MYDATLFRVKKYAVIILAGFYAMLVVSNFQIFPGELADAQIEESGYSFLFQSAGYYSTLNLAALTTHFAPENRI